MTNDKRKRKNEKKKINSLLLDASIKSMIISVCIWVCEGRNPERKWKNLLWGGCEFCKGRLGYYSVNMRCKLEGNLLFLVLPSPVKEKHVLGNSIWLAKESICKIGISYPDPSRNAKITHLLVCLNRFKIFCICRTQNQMNFKTIMP